MYCFLFVADPIVQFNLDTDSTFALICAAHAQGFKTHLCTIKDLSINETQQVQARCQEIIPKQTKPFSYQLKNQTQVKLGHNMIVLIRQDPPVNSDYLHACLILQQAVGQGTTVLNPPQALLTLNEKLYPLHFAPWIPETLVTASIDDINSFLKTHTQIIVKPIDGHAGKSVFLLHPNDTNKMPILEHLTNHFSRPIIVQKYLSSVKQGDKRVILGNGQILGVFNRIPKKNEHRSNLRVGGTAQQTMLTTKEHALCQALSQDLKQQRLWFVGIDLIEEKLTEINITSPTGIREIEALTGHNIATALITQAIDYVHQTNF